MRARLCVVVLVAVADFAAAARAEDEVLYDNWYAHYHKDAKAGWDHTRVVRTTQDGRTVWVTESESRLIRFMDGELLKTPMTSRYRVVEDEAGAVLSYRTEVAIGVPGDPQTRSGTVAKGVVSAVEDGKAKSVPYPEGALGPAAVHRAIAADLQPGATGRVVKFQPIDAKGCELSWVVKPMEGTLNVLGRHMWLSHVETTDETGFPDAQFLGQRGVEFAGTTNLGLHRWLLTEEAVAKLDEPVHDLLRSRTVPSDRPIDLSKKPVRAVFRLSKRTGAPIDVPQGGGQRIVARGDANTIDVEIVAERPDPTGGILTRPFRKQSGMDEYMASTPLVELEHPRLQEYAKDAVGELVDALSCARAIETGAKGCLAEAPPEPGFATACEAISGARGDSTEHAVLAVAFARSVGIPARLVAGFVYVEPDEKFEQGAFAFHTWAEVLLLPPDAWYPIDPIRSRDATEAETKDFARLSAFDATHVAVLRSDLATGRPMTDIVLPVLEFMKGLKIEVQEPR